MEPTEEVSAQGPRELLVRKAATLGPGSVSPALYVSLALILVEEMECCSSRCLQCVLCIWIFL